LIHNGFVYAAVADKYLAHNASHFMLPKINGR